jgi:hypothetical protein
MDNMEWILSTLTALSVVVSISFAIYAVAPLSFFRDAAAHGRYQWLNRG